MNIGVKDCDILRRARETRDAYVEKAFFVPDKRPSADRYVGNSFLYQRDRKAGFHMRIRPP